VPDGELFRKEALDALEQAADGSDGEPLHVSPNWTRAAYWVLVAAVAGSLSFASSATIGEYASGPAVVRVEGRVDLTATANGTVEHVEVQPGQHVTAGQLLVRFNAVPETAELERLQTEFEGQLAKLLRDPNDQAARQALTSLRPQRDLARTRVEQRALRAPHPGIITDVRIRPGQLLSAGELALSLTSEDTRFYVIAFLPGQYRPLLHRHMPLRLHLNGFARSSEMLTIDSVGDEVVGPAEARRYLGQDTADAVAIAGPIVLVKARIDGSRFTSDDKTFNFYDGLPGTAEARVRTQRVVMALVPGLRWLFPDGS
jgi:membrane fusion protein (multidrug efflux system)